jgi:PQQ-like domain
MQFKVSLYCFAGLVILLCSWGMVARELRPPASSLRITTWHNDNAHTGQYLRETTLTPLNVNAKKFGKLGSFTVDGQIYAQPLYWPGLHIPHMGTHNVVFVATENDSVYALDADTPGSQPLWQVNFTNPPNVTAVPCEDINTPCHVYPIVGITGTPVIDPSSKTLYVITRTKEIQGSNVLYVQRLHALDIATHAEKFGGPVEITASANGISFDSLHAGQRPGLLLLPGSQGGNNVVYIAWAAYTHNGPPILPGWIMAYDAQTLKQLAVFDTTPNGIDGGVWGSGGGIASDSRGNVYAASGDGTFDANTGGGDYGDSLLKLKLNRGTLSVIDYFTPMDQACRLQADLDLGSGAPMVLPHDGSAKFTDEVLISGKGGTPCDLFGGTYASPIYMVNRKKMGHFNDQHDNVVQTVAGATAGYWSAPAYWKGQTAAYVYYAGVLEDAGKGVGDTLRMYTLSGGMLSASSVAQSPNIFPVGSTPSISANGGTNGIVWAIERQDGLAKQPGSHPAVLHAYDATNVATELYNSKQAGTRDQAGPATKYQVPTIANGKVYVGTQTELDVYGLMK